MNKRIIANCVGASAGILLGIGISKFISKKVEKLPMEERKEKRDAMSDIVIFAGLALAILAVDKKVDKVINMCDLNMVMNIVNSDEDDETKRELLRKLAMMSTTKVQKVIYKAIESMEVN